MMVVDLICFRMFGCFHSSYHRILEEYMEEK